MIGVKLSIFGLILLGIGYLSHPVHDKKGIGYLAYLVNGFVIFSFSFILLLISLLGIEFFFRGVFFSSAELLEIVLFYDIVPNNWFTSNKVTITQADIEHLYLTIGLVLINAILVIVIYRNRKKKIIEKHKINDFVIVKIDDNQYAGRIQRIRLGKDETGKAYEIFVRYYKTEESWKEAKADSSIECDHITESFSGEDKFRITYHKQIEPDPQASVKSIAVSLIQKKGEIIVYHQKEQMISLSASDHYFYGYCELKNIDQDSQLSIDSTLTSKILRKEIHKELVHNWVIPSSFYELKPEIESLKGLSFDKEWAEINTSSEKSFREFLLDFEKNKKYKGVYLIFENQGLLIYSRVSTYRCMEVRILWETESITKNLLENE